MKHAASIPAPRRARAGFTILEVLLAMGIFLMGAAAVIGMLTFGVALTRTAQLRAASAAAVDAVMADLEHDLFPYEKGELGEPIAITNREVPGAEGVVYSAQAHPNPDDPRRREYRVDVEMYWKSAGVRRSRKFTTLMMREISFGDRLRREFVEGEKEEGAAPGPLPTDLQKAAQTTPPTNPPTPPRDTDTRR